MDSFVEQIVVKKSTAKDTLKRLGIVLGGAILMVLILFAVMAFAFPMLVVLCFGVVYLMWMFLTGTFTEYEYIVTNNELDIDKITAKRKRKRLITLKLNTAESLDFYRENAAVGVNATVEAHDCTGENLWQLIANHEKHGKVSMLFSPNDRVLFAINKSLPYTARNKIISDKEREIAEKEKNESVET